MSRSAAGLAALALCGLLAACSAGTGGTGTLETDLGGAGTPAGSTGAGGTAGPPARDPAELARTVEIRASDLPLGWKLIPGSRTGDDSLAWAVACAREAEVPVGSLPAAETPDFSPDGTSDSNQVGSATGLFASPAQAAVYVAALRTPAFGACMATTAVRAWPGAFRTVPPFVSGPFRVPTAGDAAGISTVATRSDGARLTFQFFAIRVGPIVTMLNTSWTTAVDTGVINTAASEIGARMRRA